MTAVWLYCAVSSSPQESTLEDQEQWGRDVALSHDWTITRTFSGRSSGKLGIRKILEQLLTELTATPKAQRPTRVLMIRLDRTGRVALETISALAQLKRLGVQIFTRTDGEVRLETALDTLRPIFELVSAEIENSGRADKMRAAHARFKAQGKHFGPPAYGTKKDTHGRLEPREPQASFVRRAFELRATGAGFKRIAREVGRYAPGQGTYAGKSRSSTWHQNSVSALLSCRSYRGLVVDEGLFDRVQLVRNPDWKLLRTARVYPWPLSGVLRCSCGWTMGGVASGKQGQRTRYYACRNPKQHADAPRPSIRADKAEAWLLDRLRQLVAEPELVSQFRAQASQSDLSVYRETLRTDRAELELLEQRKRVAWDLQGDGRIAAAELAQRLDDLSEKRAELLTRIAEAEQELAAVSRHTEALERAHLLFQEAAGLWDSGSWDDQKEIVRLVSAAVDGLHLAPEGLRFGWDRAAMQIDTASSTRTRI